MKLDQNNTEHFLELIKIENKLDNQMIVLYYLYSKIGVYKEVRIKIIQP